MYPSSAEHTLPVPPAGFEKGTPACKQGLDLQREKPEQLLRRGDVGDVAGWHQIGQGRPRMLCNLGWWLSLSGPPSLFVCI